MEKPSRSVISFLPKKRAHPFNNVPHQPHSPVCENPAKLRALQSKGFSGPLVSIPGCENPAKLRALQSKGFSGPIVSIIPMEARCKRKSIDEGEGFETPQEPTSPKVTCMGQIKLRKMAARCKKKSSSPDRRESKPVFSIIRRVFRRKARTADGGGSDAAAAGPPPPAAASLRAPSLGQMRRFASGRNSLRDFDWRKVAEEDGAGGAGSAYPGDVDEGSDGEDEAFIAHSAPLMVGGGVVAVEPRKEVSLWKRRILAPPVDPLHL